MLLMSYSEPWGYRKLTLLNIVLLNLGVVCNVEFDTSAYSGAS
jgi:hypothetical protein